MEFGNSKAAILAFAKTIERLVEDNLILNDSSVIGYGPRKICSEVEVEEVSIAFQSIRGFKETFKEEYNRLKAHDYTTKNKNKNMKSINERPEAGKTVKVYYNFVKDGEKGSYRGRWNGNRWEMRKPYTKDEFEPIPSEIELIGWDELR